MDVGGPTPRASQGSSHNGTPQTPFPPRAPSSDTQQSPDFHFQLPLTTFSIWSPAGADSQAYVGGKVLLLQATHLSYPYLLLTVARPLSTLNPEHLRGDKPGLLPSPPKYNDCPPFFLRQGFSV